MTASHTQGTEHLVSVLPGADSASPWALGLRARLPAEHQALSHFLSVPLMIPGLLDKQMPALLCLPDSRPSLLAPLPFLPPPLVPVLVLGVASYWVGGLVSGPFRHVGKLLFLEIARASVVRHAAPLGRGHSLARLRATPVSS